MRVYGQSYRDTMGMPIKAFWEISGNVERLWADERKAALEIAVTGRNPDGAQELYTRLDARSPQPVTLSGEGMLKATAVRDDAGFEELRTLS